MHVRARHVLTVTTALMAVTVVPVAPSFATEVAPPSTVHATMDDLEATDETPAGSTVRTEAEVPFSMIGVVLPDGVEVAEVRTRSVEGEWSDVHELEVQEVGVDGPDLGSEDAATARANVTEPLWVDAADAFEITIAGDVEDVEVSLIDTLGQSEPWVAKAARHLAPRPVTPAAEASAGNPTIVSRSQWGANPALQRARPSVASQVRFAVLHHTAGNNTYSRANAPAVVRGIQNYHAVTLGWGDIGYNLLVDRFGTIYEGRAGGLERGVVGAHAAGFNTGSFGIAVMGNHDTVDISSAALESVGRAIAWKYRVHGIDASPGRRVTVNGRSVAVLSGHRDIGSTACPGRYLYARMGALRNRIAAIVSTSGPVTRFSDVPASHTHYEAIEFLAERQITLGCAPRRYCPTSSVTRGQMASFLQRALKLPATSARPFRDVTGGTHAAAIAALHRAGITEGCTADRFCPDQRVTRAQMAAFLHRGLKLRNAPARFHDVRGHRHEAAIGALSAAGIAGGYHDGTFRPNRTISRAEMAAFLHRAPLP